MIDLLRRSRQKSFPSEPISKAPPVFSIPSGVRVYAVGDIHGRSRLLGDMLAAIKQDACAHSGKKVIEIFLGDYVDRGFYSREVIDLLLMPPPEGHERICLLGNHETALLHFLQDPRVLREWANFGGYATLASYGVTIPSSMSPQPPMILRDAVQRNLPVNQLELDVSAAAANSLCCLVIEEKQRTAVLVKNEKD